MAGLGTSWESQNMSRVALGATLFCGLSMAAASVATAQDLTPVPAFIDEIRLGVSASIQTGSLYESGMFPWATVYFDPFDRRSAETIYDELARPRVHAGAIVSTNGNASQVYSGLTWSFDVTDTLFLELGLGGTLTNATLDGSKGVNVGCSLLFHEQLSAGWRLTDRVNLVATVEHSSNANLCERNSGLSYAGIGIGYKF